MAYSSPNLEPLIAIVPSCNSPIPNGDVTALFTALQQAQSATSPVTICLAAGGTYTLTTIGDPNNAVGDTGLPRITKNVTIYGNGATIERNSAVHFRLFRVASGGNLTLNDLTLKNGRASGSSFGGAIRSDSSTLTLNRVTLLDNLAFNAGAIYGNGSTVNLTDSTLLRNTADNGGGAIYSNSTVNLTNVILGGASVRGPNCVPSATPATDGNCAKHNGGALQVFNATARATLTNVVVTHNRAAYQGAGLLVTDLPANLPVINGLTVTGNVGGGIGGGLYLVRSTTTFPAGTVISDNTTSIGGGVFVQGPAAVTFTGTILSGNTALQRGSGLYVSGATVTIGQASRFENNAARGSGTGSDGGGLFITGGAANVTVTDTVFSGNRADDQGGAVYRAGGSGSVTGSCLEVSNTAPYASAIYSANSFVATGNWWGGSAPTSSGSGAGVMVNNLVNTTGYSTDATCPYGN